MSISFTKRDYQSIREELLNVIPTLTDKWTDFNSSDVGIVLVDLISYLGEMLSYNLDRQALECYLSTVTDINNLRAMIKLVGMKTRFRIPATCNVKFSIPTPKTSPLMIPKYTTVGVPGELNLTYCTSMEASIPTGQTSVYVPCLEGVHKHIYIGTRNFVNTNEAVINDIYIGHGTYRLFDGQDYWTEINSVYLTNQVGKYFSLRMNNRNTFTLELPYEWAKLVPDNFSNFDFEYMVTHGQSGTVGANKLTVLLSDIYDYDGFRVTTLVSVNNEEASTGGDNEESLDMARRRVELNSKTMNTLVTLKDFESFVKTAPGVGNCIAFDWNSAPSFAKRPYEIVFCAISSEGLLLSDALKTSILADIQTRKYATAVSSFIDPLLKDVVIEGDIYLKRKITNPSQININILNNLTTFFKPSNLYADFNSTIYLSDIYNVIEATSSEISHTVLTKCQSTKHPNNVVDNPPILSDLVENIVCTGTEFPNLKSMNFRIHEFGTY